MSYWAVAFPFMMYLASWGTCSNFPQAKLTAALIVSDYDAATGIVFIFAKLTVPWGRDAYYSIALSLNVLLTPMLITRLVLHSKNIRRAIGDQDGASGLYKGVVIMLVESGVLYAASFVIVAGPYWAHGPDYFQYVTPNILARVQVRTAFPLPSVTSDAIIQQ